MYEIEFSGDWHKQWKKVPKQHHKRIINKMKELKENTEFRHLKFGLPYFVLEIGQYRTCFIQENNKRILVYIGTHKEYEKWLGI